MKRTLFGESAADLLGVRRDILDKLIPMFGLISLLPVLASLFRIPQIGWQWPMALHIAFPPLALALHLGRGHLGQECRANIILVALMTIGLASIVHFGLIGTGFINFLAVPIFATLVLGPRYGWLYLGGGAAFYAPILIIVLGGAFHYTFDLPAYGLAASSWLSTTVTVTAVTGLLVYILSSLIRALANSIGERDAKHRELVHKQDALEASQRALNESDFRYRAMLDNAYEFIGLLSPDGRLIEVNQTALRFADVSDDQVRGRLFWDTPWWSHSPAMRELIRTAVADAAAGRFFRSEAVHMTPDGQEHVIDFSMTPIPGPDGRPILLIPEGRDITEIRDAEKQLRVERNRMRLYLEVAETMLLAIDADQRVSMANRKCSAVLGIAEEEILGRNWFEDFVPDGEREMIRKGFAKVMAGKVPLLEIFEGEVVTTDGRRRLIAWRNCLLHDEGGRVIGTLSSGEDITDKRAQENSRLDLECKLRQAQKMESIGHLAGGIAHDFNNILGAVMGFNDLARMCGTASADPELGSYLDEINQASIRARDLVAQLLTFSRTEVAEGDAALVAPVAKEVVRLLRSTLPSTLSITLDLADPLREVRISPVNLHQILMNLGINARDATAGKGHIDIRIFPTSLPTLSPCTSCHQNFNGEFVCLSVADDGAGISPEHLSHIFEPFFTTKAVGQGTGLGLSVLHGIVHAAGGHIDVTSTPGQGSVFRIYLPAVRASALLPTLRRDPAPPAPRLSGRILIVDDEPQLVNYLRTLLAVTGCQTVGHTHPHEAFREFRDNPDAFDLVITDQTMPELTGTDLARRIHSIRPGCPVILCTGFSNLVNAENAASFGINTFFAKPVPSRQLLAAVREIFDQKQTVAE